MPLVEVTDLKTHYRNTRGLGRAVDGVSFSLEEGRTLGVVGESGSGKSQLARSIMNLLPKRGVERHGTIVFDGIDVMSLNARESRKLYGVGMAMIFQDPMTSLNPVKKIGDQITEALRLHYDMDKKFANDTAEQLLASVGIPEPRRRLNEYPHQLSGGMRQRVVIAVALSCGPKLLFADEPTTALDVTVQKQILNLLASQQRERKMAMVLITHDLGVVAGRTDDIMVMYAGRCVEKASTSELFTNMSHPYTEALFKSIPKISQPSHTRLEAIPGRPPNIYDPPVGCKFAPRCPYVQEKCKTEEPPLTSATADEGHLVRCWYPVSVSAKPASVSAMSARSAMSASAAQLQPSALVGGN